MYSGFEVETNSRCPVKGFGAGREDREGVPAHQVVSGTREAVQSAETLRLDGQ